jgi:predicted dehydrogenase
VLRIAVIGAGSWGLNHVRIVANDDRCILAAVVDPEPGALERALAIAGGTRIVTDLEQVLVDVEIDAVVVATPAPTHASITLAALRAGKHVLVEKPFALNIRDAEAVRNEAARAGRVVMVGHLMVFHPAVRRLRELLATGELGRLHYLHSTRVNLGKLRQDENALWSFGPHDLSMIDYLLGRQPVTVTARGQSVLQRQIEDVVFMTLRYSDGEMANIHLSWLHPRKERRLTLVCSQKMVEFDDVAADKLRIYDKGYDRPPEFTEYGHYLTLRDGDVYIPQIRMMEPLGLQLAHFVDCIADGSRPLTDAASGVRITAVLAAAQRSLAQDGIPVSIDVDAGAS